MSLAKRTAVARLTSLCGSDPEMAAMRTFAQRCEEERAERARKGIEANNTTPTQEERNEPLLHDLYGDDP